MLGYSGSLRPGRVNREEVGEKEALRIMLRSRLLLCDSYHQRWPMTHHLDQSWPVPLPSSLFFLVPAAASLLPKPTADSCRGPTMELHCRPCASFRRHWPALYTPCPAPLLLVLHILDPAKLWSKSSSRRSVMFPTSSAGETTAAVLSTVQAIFHAFRSTLATYLRCKNRLLLTPNFLSRLTDDHSWLNF